MKHLAGIPVYSLFGQSAGLVEPRFCHVERVGDRWKLHSGQVEEHSHPHLHQMTLWVAGTGHYVADDTITHIVPPTFCWMPAGVVHGFRVTGGSDAVVLSMSDDFAREQLSHLAGLAGNRLFQDPFVLPLDSAATAWLTSLFARMEREYGSQQAGQVECIGALARLALTETLRIKHGGEEGVAAGGNIEPSLLVRFMALVEARLGQRPGVEDLARELGSTPYLLNRACQTGLGMRASEVVRVRHMQEAKRLLLFTALSISEIGAITGYPDPAHFTRSFRALTGQSPREWRDQRIGTGSFAASQ